MLSDQDMGEKALGRSCGTKEGLGHKWLGQGLGNCSLALKPQCLTRVRSSLRVVRRPTRLNSKMKLDFAIRDQSSAHTVSPRQRRASEAFNLSEGSVQNGDWSKCI